MLARQRLAHLLAWIAITVRAIPVPNGQLGNVEIECGDTTIEAVFLTEAVFEGRIFVIGHAHDPKCISRDTGRRTTSIVIDKQNCGVATTRSNDPNGLFSTVKIMISFHNEFVTKVDRGYEISCFYMAGDKTVTYPITVATQNLAGLTELAEMPRCRYEVIDPETLQQAEVVTVGSKLLHRWICDSTAPNLWCMMVHSCRVEDGSGTQFTILDQNGCSIDRYLLDNLEYGPGELQAQKEAHAFKFADKVVVNFQCSVRLDVRDGECPIPSCGDPAVSPVRPSVTSFSATTSRSSTTRRPPIRTTTRKIFQRRPRSPGNVSEILVSELDASSMEVDVRAPQIDVLDPLVDFGVSPSATLTASLRRLRHSDCVPRHTVVLILSAATSLVIALSGTVAILAVKRRSKVH